MRNATDLVMMLLACALAFGAGWYTNYQSVKTHSLQIVEQAKSNQALNQQVIENMAERRDGLNASLASLGFTDDEIELLYQGEPSRYEKLKAKFTEYLPGETKWLKPDTVYVPREDCSDDYLGEDLATKANEIILRGGQ